MDILNSNKNLGTVCPRSIDPFYICTLLYKMGHYFLDIQYNIDFLYDSTDSFKRFIIAFLIQDIKTQQPFYIMPMAEGIVSSLVGQQFIKRFPTNQAF